MREEASKNGRPSGLKDASIIKQISSDKCGQCGIPREDHSKKNMIRCMFKADATLYEAIVKIDELEKSINKK
jgi:hypothetical protein